MCAILYHPELGNPFIMARTDREFPAMMLQGYIVHAEGPRYMMQLQLENIMRELWAIG